jgi:rSAM/selenodomain-associated transferase 2
VKERPVDGLRISVVIPAWNDRENLAQLLPALGQLNRVHETIVVDASGDEMEEFPGAQFLRAPQPNRGAQMNLGAAAATGDVLLFHHADTKLTGAHLDAIAAALTNENLVGGAFYRKFDRRHPRLMWLEQVARFLSRNGGTLYGDQSVFVRREVFASLRGFANIPLMEDMEFSKRLRAFGPVIVLDPPMESSARRHLRRGAWLTSVQNALFIVLYKCGVSPQRLHAWYYSNRCPPEALHAGAEHPTADPHVPAPDR